MNEQVIGQTIEERGTDMKIEYNANSFKPVYNWLKIPEDVHMWEVTGVAVDSEDLIYLFGPCEYPLMVFDVHGNCVKKLGKGLFKRPHHIFVDKARGDVLYCSDDDGHCVKKLTRDGELLMVIGKEGVASNTGCINKDFRTIKRSAGPFNFPTGAAVSSDGCIFITDGYGNARVHKFSPEGEHMFSWGQPGDSNGELRVPHDVVIDKEDVIYVADRENFRIQMFDVNGRFLDKFPVCRPDSICFDADENICIAVLGERTAAQQMFKPPKPGDPEGQWSGFAIYDKSGRQLYWKGEPEGWKHGNFRAAHGIGTDSEGSVYIGEVIWHSLAQQFPEPKTFNARKFITKLERAV